MKEIGFALILYVEMSIMPVVQSVTNVVARHTMALFSKKVEQKLEKIWLRRVKVYLVLRIGNVKAVVTSTGLDA